MNRPLAGALASALLLAAADRDAAALEALDRFQLGVGVFSNRLSLDGRVDGSVPFDGSRRDFADDLDLGGRRSVELVEVSWRPFERHQFAVRHYRDSRRETAALAEELRFDGRVFPVQAEIDGRAAFTSFEASYTGWLHATPASAFGVQIGVLRLGVEMEIDGVVREPTLGEFRDDARVEDHLHAPLIGIAGRRVLGSRTRAYLEARAIELRHRGIDGTAFSATFGIEHFLGERLGLALQYSDTWLEVERRSSDFNGRLEIGFAGPQALLRWRF